MALFGQPKDVDHARKWADMSIEFKLMFAYHGCMMVLFASGDFFTTRQELSIATVLLLVLTAISLHHRNSIGWRWPGTDTKGIAFAVGGTILTLVFLAAATPLFPPTNAQALPWYLAGVGIGLFNILSSLNLVRQSEAQMLADSRDPISGAAAPPQPDSDLSEPQWKRVVRGVFTCAFLLVWLAGVSSFYISGKTYANGSPVPIPTKTEPMTQHGRTVFISPDEKLLQDRLQLVPAIGIPAVLLSAVVIHFLLGVKLFPHTPSLAEYRAKRNSLNG